MIAGFGGELISHAFVEQELLPAMGEGWSRDFQRGIGQWWRRVSRTLGPASSVRSIQDVAVTPLLQLLGHPRPALAPHPLGLCGPLNSIPVICLTVPWSVPVRTCWRAAVTSGAAVDADWALISNGHSLRIVDCTRAWMRKGIEFDLGSMNTSPASLAALWLLANAAALSTRDARSLPSIIERSETHALRVCTSLGDGVLSALPRLASGLARHDQRPSRATLDEALTVVYRILFLLFAEAHGMVPVWNEIYRDAYSVDMLARRALRGTTRGAWAALRAISRLAHAGCHAGDLAVTAFNGRLFSPRHTPLIEQRRVPDTLASEILLAVATEHTRSGRRRISYFDLGVEQLGSVYERVLDYEPVASGRAIRLSKTSTERKTTGSFYTPRSITEFLVRRTLSPLTEHKGSDEILQLRVLDPAMGSGAFLVAACRYLADQCEQANLRDGRWIANEIRDADRAALRRQVAERCLFGVDLNPTAVQLARLSLWLTTLAGERPLTFLDHHLATGNSLLGARLADLSRQPRGARREIALPLFEDQLTAAVAHHVLPARARLTLPSDSVDEVRTKERLIADLTAPDGALARWSAAADAWSAAVLSAPPRPSAGLVCEWIAAATGSPTTLPAAQVHASLQAARQVAAGQQAFHWELAFPEVFFDAGGHVRADGGFDAVIGNPPWDMVRADTGTAVDRATHRSSTAAAMRFYRDAGIYRLQSNGHANRYQLFLERALQLARPGGRVGMILPSGLATDHGSAALRRHLFDRTTIDTWLGFDNRRRIFPIHRSIRFVLLATSNAGRTDTLRFRAGLTDPRVLDADDGGAPLTVSRSRLESWNDDLAVPEIRDSTALAIVSSVAGRVPSIGDAAGWHVRFGRELNATDDRPHFVALDQRRPHLLPVVEGKLLSPFQVDVAKATTAIPIAVAERLVDRASFESRRIAYRDVASATNKLTLIAALLPAGTISTHTVFVSKTALADQDQWCLLGLMNSMVANFLVRARVMTHVTAALMARLPVPRPQSDSATFSELAALSKVIASEGVSRAWREYARLNAIGAIAYGLTRDQFAYITDTFPLIDDAIRAHAREQFALLHRAVLPRLE
ncbi:MAG TPA: N-6 DNA methylase [Vicinamibacterales bacterium]|nr:N-6 DNA methylase [Vicinamibacterales bacterium]